MVLTHMFYLQSAALKTSDHWKVQWCLHNCFICSLQHWRRQTIGELLLWELAWRNSKSIWTCLFSPPPPLGPFHRHLSFAGFAVRSRARSKSKFAKWFCSLDLLDLSLIAVQILALHLNLFLKYVHLNSFGQSSLKSAPFLIFPGSLRKSTKRQSRQKLTVLWSSKRNLTLMSLYMENLR